METKEHKTKTNNLREIAPPMLKRKCRGTAKMNAWIHIMTLGLLI
jgi:hypothetical protein